MEAGGFIVQTQLQVAGAGNMGFTRYTVQGDTSSFLPSIYHKVEYVRSHVRTYGMWNS